MNRRDQELLDRQLRAVTAAPRHQGMMLAAVLTVFIVGVALGGFLFGHTERPAPLRMAANAPAQIVQQ